MTLHLIQSCVFVCVCVCDFQARMSTTREISWGNLSPRYSKICKNGYTRLQPFEKTERSAKWWGSSFPKVHCAAFLWAAPSISHTKKLHGSTTILCCRPMSIMNHIKDGNWPRSWILVKSKPSVKSPIGLWTNVLKHFGIMAAGICIFWSQKWDIWIKIWSDWEPEDTLCKHVVNHNRAKSWSIPYYIVYFKLKGTKMCEMNTIYMYIYIYIHM